MALIDHLPFGDALAHEITTVDRVASTRRGYNPYALGIMLERAAEVAADVARGVSPAAAFADGFTPDRAMHKVAAALRLPLDVRGGQWVRL